MINRMQTFLWIGRTLHSRHFKSGLTEEPQFSLKINSLTAEFPRRLTSTFNDGAMHAPFGMEGVTDCLFRAQQSVTCKHKKSLFETTSNIKGSLIWKKSQIKN
jgi:hypothetical protein